MRAVVVEEQGQVRVVDDVPMPVPGEYDALVKIVACGFCNGTDMRIIHGQMTRQQGLQPYPTVLGHEAVGIIERVGKKVRNLRVGEKHIRVQGGSTQGSRYSSTHGQMAEYGLITDWAAMKADGLAVPPGAPMQPSRLPDDFDPVACGVLLPLCECLSAVRNFDIGPSTDVLVYGAGPMGLAMMQYMKLVGAKSVTCIDSVPERLEKARTVAGVDETINFQTQDVAQILGGRLFDRVVDAVGSSAVILEASGYCKPYGMVCALGVLRKGDSSVDLSLLKNNSRLHMLNFPYEEYAVLQENISYIQRGLVDLRNYYSHVLPLEEVHQAMELVRTKQAIKVILTL